MSSFKDLVTGWKTKKQKSMRRNKGLLLRTSLSLNTHEVFVSKEMYLRKSRIITLRCEQDMLSSSWFPKL